MWEHAPHSFQHNSGNALNDPKESQDTHTHSPTKHERRALASTSVRQCNRGGPWAFRPPAVPPLVRPSSQTDPNWSNEESDTDPFNPFSDSYTLSDLEPHHSARNSGDDISMPDYQSSSSSSRAISSMTGISYEHIKQSSMNEITKDNRYDQIFRSFDPPKEPTSRAQTPAEALSSLPVSFKEPEARPVTSSNAATRRSISSILKDMSQTGAASDFSGSHARSVRRMPFDALVGDAGAEEIYAMPAMCFRTRRMPISNSKQNEDTFKTPRQRNGQAHHSTPTKASVRASADDARESNPSDPSLGPRGNVAISQSDRFGDDPNKDGLDVDHFVEPKLQPREVSVESSEL